MGGGVKAGYRFAEPGKCGREMFDVIESHRFGEVLQLKMGRVLQGQVLYWVAAYLVDGLLIDTGCRHTAQELVGVLAEQAPVRAVNTHYHEDHVGGNHLLQKNFAVELLAGPESVPLIAATHRLYPYQELVWGYPEPTQVGPVEGRIATAGFSFEIVSTPGHCPGHIVLLEQNCGWCFSGDLFASVKPRVARPEEDVGQIVASMQKLVAMTDDRLTLFTSLGQVVQGGREALGACIDYLVDLQEKAGRMAARGYTVPAIVQELYGGESPMAAMTDNQFSTDNLVRSALAAP